MEYILKNKHKKAAPLMAHKEISKNIPQNSHKGCCCFRGRIMMLNQKAFAKYVEYNSGDVISCP